jgi:hypothetical protein
MSAEYPRNATKEARGGKLKKNATKLVARLNPSNFLRKNLQIS